jgi:ankyrin repeat protein
MEAKDSLVTSVLHGDSRKVVSALRKGASANSRYRGRTVLLWAIQEGHLNVMKELVRAGALLEAKDCDGFTPHDQAVGENNLKAVRFLLKSGANVNGRCSNGSPLHTACAYRRLKTVKILLAHGANSRARDKDGCIPADFTKIKTNKIDKAIRKLLKTAKSSREKF